MTTCPSCGADVRNLATTDGETPAPGPRKIALAQGAGMR